MAYTYEFPRPSVTATTILFSHSLIGLTVAVGRRTMNTNAYPGALCFPGGFLDQDERAEVAAQRELKEEMNVDLPLNQFRLFAQYSDPKLDPRTHVVSLFFFVEVDKGIKLTAGDDLISASWVGVRPILNGEIAMAFNHADALKDAVTAFDNHRIAR